MKKKTVILIAGIVVLLLVLVFAGLPLFSRLYYGRSQAATIFAWQLDKEAYTTEEAFEEFLADRRAENARSYQIPSDMTFTVPVSSVSDGRQPGYVMNAGGDPLIIFFPGGSYIDQPRKVHWEFLNDLAERTGAEILVPIYPKLPDNDAETSYQAVEAFCTEFMADREGGEVIFMGDSAGGGMALSLAMRIRDEGVSGPDRLILICPWVDVTLKNPDIPAYEKKDCALDSEQLRHLGVLWAGDLSTDAPLISPLYGSMEGLGEVTLLTGTGELLYPDIMRLDAALADADVPHETLVWKGMFHVWPLYHAYSIPECQEAFEAIVQIIGPAD